MRNKVKPKYTKQQIDSCEFKVFRKSGNTNSFGLRGYWIMNHAGWAFEVGHSDHGAEGQWKIGQVIFVPPIDRDIVPIQDRHWAWGAAAIEIPQRKEPSAPPAVIREVWAISEL